MGRETWRCENGRGFVDKSILLREENYARKKSVGGRFRSAVGRIHLRIGQAQIITQCPSTNPLIAKGICIYSVKFLCGLQTQNVPPSQPPIETPVKPGNYATAVNVHNYHPSQSVVIAKKAVIALPEDQPPGPISPILKVGLGPDQAVEIDCQDILHLLSAAGTKLPQFIKGFVEVQSIVPISVTGVYTAQGCDFITNPTAPTCSGAVSVDVVPEQPFAGP